MKNITSSRPLWKKLAVCAVPFALLAASAKADLVWSSDFSSYDTGGGAVNLVTNATGDDDTFTSVQVSQSGANTFSAQVVGGASVPSVLTGNALRFSMVNTSGGALSNTTTRLLQYSLGSLGTSGVYIVSYDLISDAGGTGISSVNGNARTTSGSNAGAANSSFQTGSLSTGARYTMVINRTGTDIVLPGALGTLATNSTASYLYNGTAFAGLDIEAGTVTSTSITGFASGANRSGTISAGGNLTVWYDNFGVWSSASDLVDGVSVLSLAPGTLVSAIPEPSAVSLLMGAATLGAVALRRNRRGKA